MLISLFKVFSPPLGAISLTRLHAVQLQLRKLAEVVISRRLGAELTGMRRETVRHIAPRNPEVKRTGKHRENRDPQPPAYHPLPQPSATQ